MAPPGQAKRSWLWMAARDADVKHEKKKKEKKPFAMRKGSLEETVWGQEAEAAWCL